jgi:hypothetical protein
MTTSVRERRKALFDVHPVTGVSVEIFYADRTLETFGRVGAGWFWQVRRRGFAPGGPAEGPFPTSYSAYRDALIGDGLCFEFTAERIQWIRREVRARTGMLIRRILDDLRWEGASY